MSPNDKHIYSYRDVVLNSYIFIYLNTKPILLLIQFSIYNNTYRYPYRTLNLLLTRRPQTLVNSFHFIID